MHVKSGPLGNRGFNLIELVTAVAIVSILTTLAIPSFQYRQVISRKKQAAIVLGKLYQTEKNYWWEWGTYLSNFENIGYTANGVFHYNHGFGAAGAPNVANYRGPGTPASTVPTTGFNTGQPSVCAVYPAITRECSLITYPVVPAAPNPASTTAANSFIAEAVGDVDGDADLDRWTIDHQGTLSNPFAD